MYERVIFDFLMVLIPILAIVAVIRAVYRGSYMAEDTIEAWKGSRISNIKREGRVIVSDDVIIQLFKGLSRFASTVVVLVGMAIYIPLVLNLFPSTKWVAESIFTSATDKLIAFKDALIAFLPTLLFLIAVGLIVHFIIGAVKLFFLEIEIGDIEIPRFHRDWAQPSFQMVRGVIVMITALYMYSQIPGSQTVTVQGAVVITSLLAGIGARDIITDMVSGLVLTFSRTFSIGDFVEIGNVSGRVGEKSLLVTRIRTPQGEEVSIPNGKVLRNQVVNVSSLKMSKPLLKTSVTVSYQEDWRRVQDLLQKAVESTPEILSDPAPNVLQSSLDDFYVQYQLIFFIDFTDSKLKKMNILTNLHQNIRDLFEEAGVNLITPQYMSSWAEALDSGSVESEIKGQ